MASTINVVHGGLVRWTGAVDSTSAAFNAGDVLELMTNGNVRAVASTSTTSVKGLALEASYSSSATSADSKIGNPSGNRVSMLLDIAVVQTNDITSGITFSPNDIVYPQTSAATITNSSSVNQVLGKALTYTPWTQTLTWLFTVQY